MDTNNKELEQKLQVLTTLLLRVQELAVQNQAQLELIQGKLAQLTPSETKLVRLDEAWQRLGYKNYLACWRKIVSGYYRVGIEAIDRRNEDGTIPCWYLDVDKCRERDSVDPARRKPGKKSEAIEAVR
jgi:hypothetical protein